MAFKMDYNRMADEQSFSGWSFDELVDRLVRDAAQQFGRCGCTNQRACVHAAAASLGGILRIARHPDDCPDCARIHKERDGNDDGPAGP
jgi:hypothetical protein